MLPIILGGSLAVGLFGGEIADAVGGEALKLVQAILDWIYGGLKDTITPFVMEFLTRVDLVFEGGLEKMVMPLVVIGAALMVLGAVSSVIQGYGAVIAGTASGASVISGALMRIAGLALLLGAWHTVVPIAVDVANEFSGYVLSSEAVKDALAKTFGLTAAGGASAGIAAAGVAPIVLVILLTLLAICFLLLLLLKYVLTFAFALLYLGGPVMLGLGAFPGLGSVAVNALLRSLALLMVIPLAWATVFAAWAAINSTLISNPPSDAGSYALTVINGPGIFVASCLVVLGVTRVLLKMASPLGAPLSVPGARLAMAAAAYKVAPALWNAAGAVPEGPPGAEAVAEHNSRYDGTAYHRAVAASRAWDGPAVGEGMNLAAAGRSAPPYATGETLSGSVVDDAAAAQAHPRDAADRVVIDGSAEEVDARPQAASGPRAALGAGVPAPLGGGVPELGAGSPDYAGARARIAEQGSVAPERVMSALKQLDDDERAFVQGAAQEAHAIQQGAGGEEGDSHFRERIAAGMAGGRTFRHEHEQHAAAIGAGSHQTVLDSLNSAEKHPAHGQDKGYTERELRRDWTQPVADDDEGRSG